MAQSIALTKDGSDWLVEDGDIVLVRGAEATRSLILSRIPVQRREWRFNLLFGPDWDALLGPNVDDSIILASFVGELAQVPTVSPPTVGDFTIERDTVSRLVLIEGQARSDNGETVDVAFEA